MFTDPNASIATDNLRIDLLSHFDRERIPERVVHAKGSGAHGTFVATEGLEDLSQASIFKKGAECSISVRFSTVGGESGSHDCARDPRGFSVKFRTEEGVYSCIVDVQKNSSPASFCFQSVK